MQVKCKMVFQSLNTALTGPVSIQTCNGPNSLTEKFAGHYQSLIFVQRCKRHVIIPRFIDVSLQLSLNIRQSLPLQRLLGRTARSLTALLIRSKRADIYYTKRNILHLEK